MGNYVNFDPKDIEKAIEFLFERDHEIFLLLLSGEIKVGEFGPIFVPRLFFIPFWAWAVKINPQ